MSDHSEHDAQDTQTMSAESSSTQPTRCNGRVKWFNNRSGYGFVTVNSGVKKDEDVFVHHTALTTEEEQYRYLVQGEYVEFGWIKADSGGHSWQATDVKGVGGGKLMCETRNESRQGEGQSAGGNRGRESRGQWSDEGESRPPRRQWNEEDEGYDRPPHRVRGGGPRDYSDNGVEWKLVPVRRDQRDNRRRQQQGSDRGGRRPSRPREDDEA